MRRAAGTPPASARPDACSRPCSPSSLGPAQIGDVLEAESVRVTDAEGTDGAHVAIEVVAEAFEGMNSVQRQRAVYKAIWVELQDRVHAVDSMTTRTPAEAAEASA